MKQRKTVEKEENGVKQHCLLFQHFQTLICLKLGINPFPNKPWFLRVCSTSLLKTLWEKEKLLLTSNFSLFKMCFLPVLRILPFSPNLELSSANSFSLEESNIRHMGKNYFGKELTHSHTMTPFDTPWKQAF